LASRRLHLGLAQAILALLLFAGLSGLTGFPDDAVGHAVLSAADQAHASCPDADVSPAPAVAIGPQTPSRGANDLAGTWADTDDGDPDLDALAPAWLAVETPVHRSGGVLPAISTPNDCSAAYGATGPPLMTS
jgi:hypothetical protein